MATSGVIRGVAEAIQRLESIFISLITPKFPPPCVCALGIEGPGNITPNTSVSLEKIFGGDGFLWAVPRCRRTVERRLNRKFGFPQYVYKLILPKKNILVCNHCGHHYEAGHLCPHCYAKVREETESMQQAIQQDLGLSPVENEVVVLYEGEKHEKPDEFWQNHDFDQPPDHPQLVSDLIEIMILEKKQGKRVVEMKKQRPSWFSKNLLEKSTVQPSSSKDVKPTELA